MGFLFKLSLVIFIVAVITFGFSYYFKNYENANKQEITQQIKPPSTLNNEIYKSQQKTEETEEAPELSNFLNQNEVMILTPKDEKINNISKKENFEETVSPSINTSTDENLELIEITIEAKEFKFEPNIFKIKQNQPVKLIIKNTGNIPHNLKIEKENIIFQTSLIAPGDEAILEFKAPVKGEYDFYCTLSDHKMRGMFGKMIVE